MIIKSIDFWDYTRKLANGNTSLWAKFIHCSGFVGVVDYGNSVIHPGERTQACFFSKSYLLSEKMFLNALSTDKIEKREERKKNEIVK